MSISTEFMFSVRPGLSKKGIAARVVENDSFMLACLMILAGRQTDHERAIKETVSKNRRGFMSSHAVNGTTLADSLERTGALPNDDSFKGKPISSLEMARSIVVRYSKQLAAHFRANPVDGARWELKQGAASEAPEAEAPEAEKEEGWEV